ncbi:hypothetical protein U4I65_08640 [Stenotrophomonas maltophilia]|jgi:hypothetical protein|uniref:hypothetical protein n=1 Tax=Stenotrophomonas maltophilia TaxID=40324 RepID=UPI002ACC4BDA|nr:hypothetical protein [Stenotrophomonas maltophilia]MDZ5815099.1 hypothetical protein [Stenotrophomonas maltophilia]
MADSARSYQILLVLQARLQQISVSNGYRTDAGADVRTEEAKEPAAAPRITLYAGSRTFPDGARSKGEREFTLIVEARIPASLDNLQAVATDIDEDMEQALDQYLQQPLALPLQFEESIILDKPDGLSEMVVQQMYTTRYRR